MGPFVGARPTLSTRDSRIVKHSRVMTRHCAPRCGWTISIPWSFVPVVRTSTRARARRTTRERARRSVVVEPVLSVLVRARASVARGVEERARGHRPHDREIRAGVSEARARAVTSEMTRASASVRARWTPSTVARARGAGERRRGRGGVGVKAARAATENESAVGEGTVALPTTSAVVSVGVSEERVKVDEKKPRSGMRRVFADERSLETPKEESKLRDFWYPVMFESKFNKGQEIEFDIVLFDETWVIRQVSEGEYACESKADSSKTLPTGVKDGLVMVWTGTCKTPSSELPSHFAPPSGYTIHAELIIDDVPVEHGLLMENLLDLAHAPFTHTGTFAKGWGVPNMVKFASRKLRKEGDGWHDMSNFLANGRSEGSWKPYPIDMKFLAPCMVDSHIGLSQAAPRVRVRNSKRASQR